MEPDEQTDVQDQPTAPDEPPTVEMDLSPPEATPAPAPEPAPPEPQELAEPGVYVCIHENAGEHAILGVLVFGEEYDYSATQDERTLAAVAACVAGGYLEKV